VRIESGKEIVRGWAGPGGNPLTHPARGTPPATTSPLHTPTLPYPPLPFPPIPHSLPFLTLPLTYLAPPLLPSHNPTVTSYHPSSSPFPSSPTRPTLYHFSLRFHLFSSTPPPPTLSSPPFPLFSPHYTLTFLFSKPGSLSTLSTVWGRAGRGVVGPGKTVRALLQCSRRRGAEGGDGMGGCEMSATYGGGARALQRGTDACSGARAAQKEPGKTEGKTTLAGSSPGTTSPL